MNEKLGITPNTIEQCKKSLQTGNSALFDKALSEVVLTLETMYEKLKQM